MPAGLVELPRGVRERLCLGTRPRPRPLATMPLRRHGAQQGAHDRDVHGRGVWVVLVLAAARGSGYATGD
jgi:hypothetical protein